MKAIPTAPALSELWDDANIRERLPEIVQASGALSDAAYLHWDKLRHLGSRQGLTSREWWLGLKFKRQSSRISFEELLATNGKPLAVTRHARVDAGVARMDRLLAGRVAMPSAAQSDANKDQYIASSLMEEAIHSSIFEGAVSTREEAKDMLRSQRDPINRDERMILNNYRAMIRIREMAKAPLTTDAVLELHRILTDETLERPDCAGRLQRPDEERVAIVDNKLNRVVYSPPPAEQLPERMARLVEFANADDTVNDHYVHPVIRSILLHFQLAYDHPFWDGNGRTARALFYWSMLHRGYWLAEYFSISRPLLRRRHSYEEAYLQVESDEQDGTYFVLQQLDVLDTAVDELFAYVQRKNQAQVQLRKRLKGREEFNNRQLALLDHALRRPDAAYTHESHANSHRIALMTARSDLLHLVERGLLEKSQPGKRILYEPVSDLEERLA